MRWVRVFRWGRPWRAACNRTCSRRLHGRRRRLTGPRVGRRMWGAGLRSRRRDGVADRERFRRCPGLRRRAPAGLVELPCARRAAWPSPLSSPVSRVRAAAWRTWFVVEPFRQFSGSLRERQTAASKGASGSRMGRESSGSDSAPSAKGSSGFRVGKGGKDGPTPSFPRKRESTFGDSESLPPFVLSVAKRRRRTRSVAGGVWRGRSVQDGWVDRGDYRPTRISTSQPRCPSRRRRPRRPGRGMGRCCPVRMPETG